MRSARFRRLGFTVSSCTATISVLLASLLGLTGCGVDPADLAPPGANVAGPTYRIDIQFANVLNLPSHARVMANGAQVGQLAEVSVVDPSAAGPGSVTAGVDIRRSVRLPADTTAQLRQDTILGDIYIALDIPRGATGPAIAPGGLIPLNRTEPALQIEDMLSGLATFVNGGALHSAQDIIDQVNAALPAEPPVTQHIADVLKNDVIDVGNHQPDLDAFLDSIDVNAQLILNNKAPLQEILTPDGVVDITGILQSLIHVVGVVGALGGIAHALQWVAPLARAGDAAASAFVPMLLDQQRPLDLSAPSNLNRLTDFIEHTLIPWAQRPTVDIYGVSTEPPQGNPPVSTRVQTDRIVATLRMIGMVR